MVAIIDCKVNDSWMGLNFNLACKSLGDVNLIIHMGDQWNQVSNANTPFSIIGRLPILILNRLPKMHETHPLKRTSSIQGWTNNIQGWGMDEEILSKLNKLMEIRCHKTWQNS